MVKQCKERKVWKGNAKKHDKLIYGIPYHVVVCYSMASYGNIRNVMLGWVLLPWVPLPDH